MANCKECGKPLILSGGKCIYCGASPYDILNNGHRGWSIKKAIDIVFCVDCSWPIAPVLDSIKDNIVHLIEDINQHNKEARIVADWRARVMGVRNFEEDNEYLLNDNPFVSTLEEVKCQLSDIICKGYSENSPMSSSIDAIWYAIETTDWRYKASANDEGVRDPNWLSYVVVFTASHPSPVNIKTITDLPAADSETIVLVQTLNVDHVKLTLFGPDDPVFKEMRVTPGSEINLFEDPIEFYYHKRLDFSSIINSFDESLS